MSNYSSTAEKPNPHIAVNPEWLELTRETILEPALTIIDAHHHLWDRSYYPYLLRQYLADTGSGHNIRKTVVIESRTMYRASSPALLAPIGETEFANGIAAMSASGEYGPTEVCAAIVGHVDLRSGAQTREVLEAHIQSGGGRFRGIRNSSAWHADKELVGSRFPQGFRVPRAPRPIVRRVALPHANR
jgi:L-fuconolactonase